MAGGGTDFTKAMRARSRGIHDTSDALVNAKLGITMSDDSVWAEGRFQHHCTIVNTGLEIQKAPLCFKILET